MPLFCFAGVVAAPFAQAAVAVDVLFDKAAGAVDAPPLLPCRSRGRSLCSSRRGRGSISRPPLLQFLFPGATTSFRR